MLELHNRRFETFSEAEAALTTLAETSGFAVSVLRRKDKDKESGVYFHTAWECFKGKLRDNRGTGVRDRAPGRANCQWQASVTFYKRHQAWIVNIKNDTHNHSRSEGGILPGNRRRKRKNSDLQERMGQLSQLGKLPAWDVSRQLRTEFPESGVIPRDIQNLRDNERRNMLGGLTATQVFFQELWQDPNAFIEHWPPEGQPQYIFWTYRWCLEEWRNNWEVLSFDDTYKTNRFNMPLAQVTGVTCVNTTFNIAWCLMRDEKEDSHRWFLSRLQEIASRVLDRPPEKPLVVVSDFDNAFRSACRSVFGETTFLQLCIWHVMKNVAYNIRLKWRGTLDGTELGRRIPARGGRRREEEEDEAGVAAAERMADGGMEARERLLLGAGNQQRLYGPLLANQRPPSPGGYEATADGLFRAWRDCVYAPNGETYNRTWEILQRQFSHQQGEYHDYPHLFKL